MTTTADHSTCWDFLRTTNSQIHYGHPSAHHRGWDDPAHGPGTQESLGTIPSMQSYKHKHGVGTHGNSGPDKVWDKDFCSRSNQESFRLGCGQKRHLSKGTASVAFRRWQEKVHFWALNKLHNILLTLEDSK